jgi:integrase
MVNKGNFTAKLVASLQCEPDRQQSIHWDGKTPGLGLRVTPAGAKSYIFETRLHGKTVRLTIGNLLTWPVGKAQEEATRLKAMTDQGIDPREVKADQAAASTAKRNEAKRQHKTLGEVWPDYLNAKKGKWSTRHHLDHQRLIAPGGAAKKGKMKGQGLTVPGVLSPLARVRLCDLTGERVTDWLNSPETIRRPTQARRAFTLLRAFVGWCSTKADLKGIVPSGACASRVVKDTLPKPAAKDDCLQREQLPLWFEHVRKLDNPVHSAYLQSLLLTGARREELAAIRWVDVDFQWKGLTIHDKVEGERVIPLTPYVALLMAALPRRNEWVFSSPMAKSGRLMEPRIGHNRALAAAGLPALSLHGLRRSFGTLAEWVEVPAGVVAQIMGHKPSAIAEKHYRRRSLDLLRMWHVKIEAWILEEAGIKQPKPEQATKRLRVVKKV